MYDKPQKVAKRSPADNEGWVARITICFFFRAFARFFWDLKYPNQSCVEKSIVDIAKT